MHIATAIESGPLIRIEGKLESQSVTALAGMIGYLPEGATITVSLTHATSVEPHALVQLHDLVRESASRGRAVLLLGLTMAQARLLALARSPRP
jgi:hypothetical protein